MYILMSRRFKKQSILNIAEFEFSCINQQCPHCLTNIQTLYI